MATLYWSHGDHWSQIHPALNVPCSQQKSLVSMRAGDCGGKMQVSMLVGSVSREEPTEWISLCPSQCLPGSPLSPSQSEGDAAGGAAHFPPSTSIALYFQLNCSLSNKYFGTNVKLIHSFNKYALSINYKPCTRISWWSSG